MNELFCNINYQPFTKGRYDVSPSFKNLVIDEKSSNHDNYVFQIDNNFQKYIDNKISCRNENIEKYYQESNLKLETSQEILKYIIGNLITSYPKFFVLENLKNNQNILNCFLTNEKIIFNDDYQLIENSKYKSLFDAIVSQVQEDIVICQLDDKDDYMSLIHLCSPSYWSATEKIGKNFAQIHHPVAGMEKILTNYRIILDAIIKKGDFYRFAWGINLDNKLNHHPDKLDEEKIFNKNNSQLFIRVERQTLIGFKNVNSILFTIKTYYQNVLDLDKNQINLLNKSLLSMSIETLKYKKIENDLSNISDYLKNLEKTK